MATPITTPDSGNTWLEGILWGSQWSSGAADGAPTIVDFYIAGMNESEVITLDNSQVTALSPVFLEEMQAMISTMQLFASVANVQFHSASQPYNADIIWASVSDEDAFSALGWANPPGTEYNSDLGAYQSLVAINWEAYNPSYPDPNMLAPGSFDYVTFIHEFGHAMGLAHPHDNGGGSTIFPGVTQPFGSYGSYDMNQGVYTMMSYNDGWQTAPHGASPSQSYGYEMGPMALDIAALQLMYGRNDSYRTGNDVYALPTANQIGTGYRCIWDAGGIDKIVGGDDGNVIDLRAATLLDAPGGGGWVSYATGIHGGFTIAHGVIIENATGGDGVDTLRGNEVANTLIGLDGADTLDGGLGADKMVGGEGDDTYFVDNANDIIVEGASEGALDRVFTSVSYTLKTGVYVELLRTTSNGSTSGLKLVGNEVGQTILGNAGANTLDGAGGNDILVGGLGADKLIGGDGRDTASYEFATSAVSISLATPSSNTGEAAGDTYTLIENLRGSNHSDTINGSTLR